MSTSRWSTELSSDAVGTQRHRAPHAMMRVILAGVTACAMLFASFSIVGTQTALAALIGATQSRVSDMEQGVRPIPPEAAVTLGRTFGVPTGRFLL